MTIKISKGLKWLFFVHFIVALFFGVVFTMLVEIYLDFIEWPGEPYLDMITIQLLGFAFYAFALSSFIAWKETEWEKVKIIVIMEIAWFMGGVYIMFWQIYFRLRYLLPLPLMMWIYLIMFSAFLIAFIVFYIKHEKEKKNQTNL